MSVVSPDKLSAPEPVAVPRIDRTVNSVPFAPVVCLALLLALGLPQFLRMPLTNDTELFDLQAAILSEGGVLYRDALEPNLPGVVWIHRAVRAVLGQSSEAMRSFDLCIVAGVLIAAGVWLGRSGQSARHVLWGCTAAALCYLSLSEWCHCQRDTWMLLPVMGGMILRWRAVKTLRCSQVAGATLLFNAYTEGLVWGAGVWIKPYVVIPAVLVWGVSVVTIRRPRPLVIDAAGLVLGGLTVGAGGVFWMVQNGCWPYFLETMRDWNPGYFVAGRAHWTRDRFLAMELRLFPWCLLHLVAVPIALRALFRRETLVEADRQNRALALRLLSAGYLGWLGQSFFLQHLFDYVHVPALLLATFVLTAAWPTGEARHTGLTMAAVGFAMLAVSACPLLRPARLHAWTTCVAGASTPQLRDSLAHLKNPNHQNLERIADFLRRNNVQGHDVCFYNSDFVSLYRKLGLRPPTRYTYLFEISVYFPEKRSQIEREVADRKHRYVVTDLVSCGIPAELAGRIGLEGPLVKPLVALKSSGPIYPFSQPVVYRAGTYLIHRVDNPIGRLWSPYGEQDAAVSAHRPKQ